MEGFNLIKIPWITNDGLQILYTSYGEAQIVEQAKLCKASFLDKRSGSKNDLGNFPNTELATDKIESYLKQLEISDNPIEVFSNFLSRITSLHNPINILVKNYFQELAFFLRNGSNSQKNLNLQNKVVWDHEKEHSQAEFHDFRLLILKHRRSSRFKIGFKPIYSAQIISHTQLKLSSEPFDEFEKAEKWILNKIQQITTPVFSEIELCQFLICHLGYVLSGSLEVMDLLKLKWLHDDMADLLRKESETALTFIDHFKVFLETATPDEWHQVAWNWNWDSGIDELNWIIQQKACDKGTALLIYWYAGPGCYSHFQSSNEVFLMLQAIEKRMMLNQFERQEIAFNPRDDYGYDWTTAYEDKRGIPEIMYAPSLGAYPEQDWDYIEGIPTEIWNIGNQNQFDDSQTQTNLS